MLPASRFYKRKMLSAPPLQTGSRLPQQRHLVRWTSVLVTAWLISGCSVHDAFCNLIEPDSYVLNTAARCQTMHVSVDYDRQTDFGRLQSYAWTESKLHRSEVFGDLDEGRLHQVISERVDTLLAEKGFSQARQAADLLVSYEVLSELHGKLVLRFVDPADGRQLWRGESVDQGYRARNLSAWKQRILEALDMLLQKFPPASGS